MDATQRALAILNHFASTENPLGVTEISKYLGVSKASVFRILSTMEREQWVLQDKDTQKYRLSGKIVDLGLTVLSRLDILSVSLPYMYELNSIIGETVALSIRVGLERVYIHQVTGKREVRIVGQLGVHTPLWVGAASKCILAYMPDREVRQVFNQLKETGEHVLASGKIVSAEKLREELDEARRQGFAVAVGERIAYVCSVAAPIFAHNHRVSGALSVLGALPAFNLDVARDYGPMVSKTARMISLQMGDNVKNLD